MTNYGFILDRRLPSWFTRARWRCRDGTRHAMVWAGGLLRLIASGIAQMREADYRLDLCLAARTTQNTATHESAGSAESPTRTCRWRPPSGPTQARRRSGWSR